MTGCWKVTHTIAQADPFHRVRYLRCRRCGLRVKTEERLDVPWDERHVVSMATALLPEEGVPIYLHDKGITELPLHRLNGMLARFGLMVHASKGDDPKRLIACMDEQGRIEQYGVFELRRLPQRPSGRRKRRG
jgi:hypothetical protein